MSNKHTCFNLSAIAAMDDRYRINFINSLSGFKSANLIGTQDGDGHLNLAMFSSVVHIGANPPLIGVISRPDSVARHTLENIRETGVYTINSVSEAFYQKAHHTSARSEREESEFEFSGLHSECIDAFGAPFVQESPLKIAMKLDEIMPIKRNGTYLIVGEVIAVYLSNDNISDDGFIDHHQVASVCVSGLDSYHRVGSGERLNYAKKTVKPEKKT